MSTISGLLQAILPVFVLLAAGCAAHRLGWLQPAHSEGLNGYVYYLAFPILLFIVIARTPFKEILRADFLGTWSVALLVGYLLASVLSLLWQRDGIEAMAVRGFNSSCGNTSMIGIPLCIAAFGKDAALFAVLATIINAFIGVSMTVLFIESARQGGANRAHLVGRIGLSLVKNPLIIAFAFGFAWSALFGVPPLPVKNFCEMLGASAIPCSLVATGLFFSGRKKPLSFAEASMFSFIKLLIQPTIAWIVSRYIFKLDYRMMAIVVTLSAMPLASTCFVIAQRFNVLSEETSANMVTSTAVSLVTLSILLWWLQI